MSTLYSLNNEPLHPHSGIRDAIAGVVILAGGLSTRMGSPKALLKLPSSETLLDYHVRQAQTLGMPVLIADAESGYGVNKVFNAMNTCNAINSLPINSESATPKRPAIVHIKDYQPKSGSNGSNGSNRDSKAQTTDQATGIKQKHSAGPLSAILSAMHYLINDKPANSPAPVTSKWLVVVSCDGLVSAVDICQCVEKTYANKNINASEQFKSSDNLFKAVCLADNERLYPLLGMYQLGLEATLMPYLESGQRRVMRFIDPVCETVAMPKHWYSLSNLNTPDDFIKACQVISQ